MSEINIKHGWNWFALFIGPFWYIFNGLLKKGIILLVIVIISIGLAAPFVWIYCAVRANPDLYEKKLFDKSRLNERRGVYNRKIK